MERILFSSAVMCLAVLPVIAANPAIPEKVKNLLQSVNLGDIRQFDKKDLLKKVPLDTDKIVFNVYFLEPRQILNLHKHPESDEMFYIVEGRGQFTLGNEQIMVDSGSAVYGPTNTPHGIVNSGSKEMVVISVQAPKPVQTVYSENSTITCPVCKQEDIIPVNAKEGDIFICPRCQAKLKLSKTKDGKWLALQS